MRTEIKQVEKIGVKSKRRCVRVLSGNNHCDFLATVNLSGQEFHLPNFGKISNLEFSNFFKKVSEIGT